MVEGAIFLFLGLQGAGSNGAAILQPVLQWGSSYAGGGLYWSLASYFVQGSPGKLVIASNTDAVPIQPNTRITSKISLVKHASDNGQELWTYRSEFVGFAGTKLTVQSPTELLAAGVALEAYGLAGCDSLPPGPICFEGVTLEIDGAPVTSQWLNRCAPSCGLATSVSQVVNAAVDVTITYD
ncbi:hypothetical protein [Mesorhizobium sp. LSHC414A00]|uniref:hypothetical protein n=1 Tax=Mesorhizobium sp. LSHC414A00 TaxID=1287287 RepID=UPI0003CF99F7|nr:hypothetical protein [Mesorhizobium sp. LSHC414A00]ESX80003.1 hypothetical protein X757_03290 [Mesorhizobium sp. LSHC414A00]